MAEIPVKQVEIVEIYPTEFWYEKDMMGTISIKMQHQTMHEFALIEYFCEKNGLELEEMEWSEHE